MNHPPSSHNRVATTNGDGNGTGPANGDGHHTVDPTLTTAPFPSSRKVYVDGTLP